jgi:hypothetical protein
VAVEAAGGIVAVLVLCRGWMAGGPRAELMERTTGEELS